MANELKFLGLAFVQLALCACGMVAALYGMAAAAVGAWGVLAVCAAGVTGIFALSLWVVRLQEGCE